MKVYATRRDEKNVTLKGFVQCESPIKAILAIKEAGGSVKITESAIEKGEIVGVKPGIGYTNGLPNIFFSYDSGERKNELVITCEIEKLTEEGAVPEKIESYFAETVTEARQALEKSLSIIEAVESYLGVIINELRAAVTKTEVRLAKFEPASYKTPWWRKVLNV